jgi:predicted DNA-binding transcriptional regulator AlpA
MSDQAASFPAEPPDRILTLDQVAERVPLSTRTVYRAILAGDLRPARLTARRRRLAHLRVRASDWIARRRTRPAPRREPACSPSRSSRGARPLGPARRAPRASAGARLVVGATMGREA